MIGLFQQWIIKWVVSQFLRRDSLALTESDSPNTGTLEPLHPVPCTLEVFDKPEGFHYFKRKC